MSQIWRNARVAGTDPFLEGKGASAGINHVQSHKCTAEPLFSLPFYFRGSRTWMIMPEDDVAFALNFRWL